VKIDILTLFPKMFDGVFSESIIKRAKEKGLVEINIHNLRNWAKDKHKVVDSPPYGGGPGMVMKVDVIDRAIKNLTRLTRTDLVSRQGGLTQKIILLDAAGEKFNQKKALQLTKVDHLILIAGHYEGVDHRVHEHIADEIISIGDYVLTGGEIPAMVLVDTIVRLIPRTLGNPKSITEELPVQYTRPENYKGWEVPKVLLSGNHSEIKKWRKTSS